MTESRFVVRIADGEIINERPEGTVERVALADLQAVLIQTDDTGPWGADVWWLLIGKDMESGCVFPQGATGEKAVMDVLMDLPGFDHGALIDAMGCTDNRRFLCWEAEGEGEGRGG